MKLLTKALEKEFAKIGRDEKTPTKDKKIIAKFFNPTGHATWFATEYDPEEKMFFGWVTLFPGVGEWGYFSLDELESLRLPFGLKIERDRHFKIEKASDSKEFLRYYGSCGNNF